MVHLLRKDISFKTAARCSLSKKNKRLLLSVKPHMETYFLGFLLRVYRYHRRLYERLAPNREEKLLRKVEFLLEKPLKTF